uniref:Uncharacterized protein n=1 Tax=Anguilla anguilla TaxID=7936 RepID=A0A0E9PC72_ANGAN
MGSYTLLLKYKSINPGLMMRV